MMTDNITTKKYLNKINVRQKKHEVKKVRKKNPCGLFIFIQKKIKKKRTKKNEKQS